MVDISAHHDSAVLAGIVAGVVEEPIHFEYFPITDKGKRCALLRIPSSPARPHWPKRDFGILRKHVFYTRRAASNVDFDKCQLRQASAFSGLGQTQAMFLCDTIVDEASMNFAPR